MEGNIIQLKEYHLNKGASKDHTPVFPMTKASAIEGMSELLRDLKINGVTPTSDISDVSSPEKGKIYYEESTDKYYVYNENKSNFIELGAGTSVEPSDIMPTVTQTTSSSQSGGDNIITFTFPNGETTQVIIKNGQQGTQGDSGYTGAANELRVANSLDDDDPTAAISAACANELKTQAFVEKGTFAEAYAKANENNVVFPWLMEDEDSEGNPVTKMIWHVGDLKFVDAVGSEIVGDTSGAGIKVSAAKNGYIRFYQTDDAYKSIPVYVGDDNLISFEDLLVNENDSIDPDNPSRLKVVFYDSENSAVDKSVVTKINFGGLRLTTSSNFGANLFANNTTIEEIRGLVLDYAYRAFMGASNLRVVEVSGGSASSPLDTSSLVNNCKKLEELYAKDLYGSANLGTYAGGTAAMSVVDMRNIGFSLSGETAFQGWGEQGITTFILGAGVDLSVDATSLFYSGGNVTNLVYMNDTPPTLTSGGVNETWLNGSKVTNIYVPADSVTAYQTAWSGVSSSRIKGYTEVNGKIVFES